MKKKIIDSNMQVKQTALPHCVWHNFDDAPMIMEGIKYRSAQNLLRRMPISTPEHPLPVRVDGYADHSSGGILRFRTDSSFINISACVEALNNSADIMTSGRIGFDAYVVEKGEYRHVGTTRLNFDEVEFPVHSYQVPLLFEPNQSGEMREYELNFPLYGQVRKFSIGFAPDAKITAPSPRESTRPIVWYGTSIIQGCCSSRSGLGPGNRLSRKLNREVINLGFAGSGCGEPEVAEAIAQIENPACFILSYDENVSANQLEETLPGFVDILRAHHPEIPILTISKLRMPTETSSSSPERIRRNAIHIANVNRRKQAGDDHIFFMDGFSMYDSDLCDCYVDSCHPNDYGMTRYINHLYPELQKLLNGCK